MSAKTSKTTKSSKKKKRFGLGLVFWIVFACVILIIFAAKKDDMLSVLKQTEFFGHVFGSEPEFVSDHDITGVEQESENTTESEQTTVEKAQITVSKTGKPVLEITVAGNEAQSTGTDSNSQKNNDAANKTSDSSSANNTAGQAGTTEADKAQGLSNIENSNEASKVENKNNDSEVNKAASSQAPVSTATMDIHLWFVVIDGDGTIVRKDTVRKMTKSGTPLADSIAALLSGPTDAESSKGFTSLIPSGTQLLGASVREKVATLNFSDNFMYNTFGVEGYLGQLMQIVYTATAFPTIDSVQFLIDGEKSEFIGEGVRIGVPLSRASFM